MKNRKAKTRKEKQSSSAFFQNLTPKFLDWKPPTEDEKALGVKARRKAREAELKRVTALAKVREEEKAAIRKRGQSTAARNKR